MIKMCECWFHRYHCFHLCVRCNEVFDHSQGSWDKHKLHGDLLTLPIEYYQHGITADQFRHEYISKKIYEEVEQ